MFKSLSVPCILPLCISVVISVHPTPVSEGSAVLTGTTARAVSEQLYRRSRLA